MTKKELIQKLKDLYWIEDECPIFLVLHGEDKEIKNVSYRFKNGVGSIIIVP